MNNQKSLQLTRSQISRAQQVCEQVGNLLKANKPANDLSKCDPADSFFQDPSDALLSEDAIKTAPESFIALAAFMAQAIEGLQKGFEILNQKVDSILQNQVETNGAVLKAQVDQLDLIKATMEASPVESFRSPAAYVQDPLNKANQQQHDKAPKSYVIEKLEKMIESKQATAQDMAVFENSGRLPSHLKEAIDASWNSDKVNFK